MDGEKGIEIGIIGGSGLYTLIENEDRMKVVTKYGDTSEEISIGRIMGREVAFIPRHGAKHTIPPHKVPYRGNIEALASIGVKRIISTSASGSLSKDYKPGELVFFDQFVNMTSGREDTFSDKGSVIHVSSADPYCSELRSIAAKSADKIKANYHKDGTVVVINGPRFSTKAESQIFSRNGFHAINMTQYPEAALAIEKAICYMGIGIITDYDAGIVGEKETKPVSYDEVVRTFLENSKVVKDLISDIVKSIPKDNRDSCNCKHSLDNSKVNI